MPDDPFTFRFKIDAGPERTIATSNVERVLQCLAPIIGSGSHGAMTQTIRVGGGFSGGDSSVEEAAALIAYRDLSIAFSDFGEVN
jgi:xanthine dehydrogenase molybdopterin-binding subunit B